jgi:hypothetical protein
MRDMKKDLGNLSTLGLPVVLFLLLVAAFWVWLLG